MIWERRDRARDLSNSRADTPARVDPVIRQHVSRLRLRRCSPDGKGGKLPGKTLDAVSGQTNRPLRRPLPSELLSLAARYSIDVVPGCISKGGRPEVGNVRKLKRAVFPAGITFAKKRGLSFFLALPERSRSLHSMAWSGYSISRTNAGG